MSEKTVTKEYSKNKITLKEYRSKLRKIAEKRHKKDTDKRKNKRSMSSTKWN